MNSNIVIMCNICEKDIDCRIGYSNRLIQPLSFACPHCGSLMYITLDITNAPSSNFQFKYCQPSINQPSSPFDGTNPFVDLHLDFPVRFGKYVMGDTPYLMAMKELSSTSNEGMNGAMRKMHLHSQRLDQLNHFHNQSDQIKIIIRLYKGKNKQLFKKRVGEFLDKDQGPSLKAQDVNASLYQFISTLFLPFVKHEEVNDVVLGFTKLIYRLHGENFSNFIGSIISSGFIETLQRDCLNIYPEIYDAEMPLRAAFFLDLSPNYEKAKTAARISTKDFQTYKDLYKDILEVFSRQLIIVAAINNLIHRGDSETFKTIDGGRLSSLEKFAGKTLTDKFKYLDDCWYNIDKDAVDASVRNAIAHNNVDYNEITQVITYYPDGDSLIQKTSQKIFFLDFMRLILILFREMHNLHHLIKCLFNYEFLVRNKP